MKIYMILRRPEEGFETAADVANLFNIDIIRRTLMFYFGIAEAKTFGIYEFKLENEPDQDFWVIVEEEENGDS